MKIGKHKWVLLGEVAVQQGIQTGPFGSQLKAEEYTESGVPVVMPKDIYNGLLTEKSLSRISEKKALKLSKHKIAPGDIIFPRRGNLRRIGVALPENAGWICGTGCLRARLNADLSFLQTNNTKLLPLKMKVAHLSRSPRLKQVKLGYRI